MLRIANVGIQLLQIVGDTVTFYRMTRRPVLSSPACADRARRPAGRGRDCRRRRLCARRGSAAQRRSAAPPVGVNDRVLNGVQRQAWLAGRPWLECGTASARVPPDRRGWRPPPRRWRSRYARQLRRRRIETVVRVAQRVAAPGAMDQVQMVGKRRPALLAGQAEGQKRGWRAAGAKPHLQTSVGE